MFKIESYITPILLSYVDKYVKDFKPADAQVSLWGGGVVLHNLVLKTDVVQQEVPLPFTLVSGRIHELLIQVPWTKIMSEPIVVTIDTIECILNQRPANEQPKSETSSGATQVVEAPPGYMQALVRRIVSNIAIKIHHLIVKYVQDDIVLSLNVKHLSINSTGPNWEPAFADIDSSNPAIRRLIVLDDLTLCLDNTDSDGKIRFYQDPLLYRCGLEFRVLAKLVSANTRRASSFDVQMDSTKIAWGVTSAQLLLLLRLVKERAQAENQTPSPTSAPQNTSAGGMATVAMPTPTQQPTLTATEPSRRESWSDWAWSWKSSSTPRGGKEEATMTACPTPIKFSAFLDEISLVIKVFETDASTRKRSRSLLEFTAAFTAIKCWICVPTLLRAKLGIRSIVLKSTGKCTCGHHDLNSTFDEPTIYLSGRQELEEDWEWPKDNTEEVKVAQVAEDVTVKVPKSTEETIPEENKAQASGAGQSASQPVEANVTELKEADDANLTNILENRKTKISLEFHDLVTVEPPVDSSDQADTAFWKKLSPVIELEFVHERSPPNRLANPYDNPPKDFEYSDWEELSDIRIHGKPINFRLCMGLVHRLVFIKKIFEEVAPPPIEPMRVLTVEECEALNQNLPQRRIRIDVDDFRIDLHPWDHSAFEKPVKEPILLRIEMPKINVVITAPLYPQRVCSAAGQLPEDAGLLWRGCRMHTTAALNNIKISVCSTSNDISKPCGRISLRFVTHVLLYPEYFERKRSVRFSYAVKISEINVSGSAPRLHAAAQVVTSLMNERISPALRQTSLAKDALADEDLVALDVTAEELTSRGFMAKNVITHIVTLKSLRATVFQSKPNKEMQQAWLFSGPDVPTTSVYLRLGIQLCDEAFPGSIEFIGLWTEPTALAIDPLLASWLSYKPTLKLFSESNPQVSLMQTFSSTQHFAKKTTPPSSSGRGLTRSGTASAEVHNKSRSRDSVSSEPSEKKDPKTVPPAAAEQPAEPWWMGKHLLKVHERLKKVLICVEFGLALIYVPTKTATAVDCETVRVAMENHASFCQPVVVYCLGRWSLHTNNVTKHLWHVINHEGPTFIAVNEGEEANNDKNNNSFPWNMLLADMTCYILEAPDENRMKSDLSSSLRSQLKETNMIQSRTILELVSTNIALSVVTKALQHKMIVKAADTSKQTSKFDKREAKLRYFTTGTEFKPSTFVEFMRGPTRRKKDNATQSSSPEETQTDVKGAPIQKVVDGPIVSLGFNMHADTPPLVFRFEYNQVQLVSVSLHCIKHVIELLKRNPVDVSRQVVQIAASKSFSRVEMDDDFMTESDQRSEDRLITVFTVTREKPGTIKTFFWFQWVISRVTAVVTIEKSKLALDIDDVSMSIDLQEHYKQLKIKINSIFIKNFEQSEDNSWVPGAFGGRVLDAREPAKASDDPHFLIVTITAARISTLPESWKEELHPKLLEQQTISDTMWEVYTVLASLEVVLVPEVIKNIVLLNKEMSSHKSCTSCLEQEKPTSTFELPYCYLSAGGLKMLIASSVDEKKIDNTFVVTVGKISVNPHPDNPICRRPTSSTDVGWSSVATNLEGRQYEVTVRNIAIETAEFGELATEQKVTSESKIANENPAVKWSTTVVEPTLSPVLHPLSIDLLLAPALYVGGSLVCGPALELNFTSDCVVELNIDQLALINSVKKSINQNTKQQLTETLHRGECPYLMFLQNQEEDGNFIINPAANQTTLIEDDSYANATVFSGTADSGMETATTQSTFKSTPFKKRLSFCLDSNSRSSRASDFLEVFVTTGMFEISLYTYDDGSELIQSLRRPDFDKIIPDVVASESSSDINKKKHVELKKNESMRHLDFGRIELTDVSASHLARITPKCVPLLHATFHQPNLYYWKRKSQKNLQISLFNVWFGLGMGLVEGFWRSPILSTTRGIIDPVTEIPPALATMKYTSGSSGDGTFFNSAAVGQRGTLNLDIERPVHIETSEDNVRRLVLIFNMIQTKLAGSASVAKEKSTLPKPNKMRNFFIHHAVEVATIRTSQIGLSGAGATLGLDSASLQVFLSSRRDQLSAKGLISALMLSNNIDVHENNLTILHPIHIGIKMNFSWEAWQRAEGGLSANEPSTRILLDMDSINIDLSPQNLAIVEKILRTMETLRNIGQKETQDQINDRDSIDSITDQSKFRSKTRLSITVGEDTGEDHFYKDDLRSGAFKILSGNHMPMAYQVVLNKNGITWRYPHPRAITKLVAFPIPNQNEETDCMLEFYSLVLNQWEPYINIKLPVSEPREIILHNHPPELIFSSIWRIHTLSENEKPATYQFNIIKYLPTGEPSWLEDINAVDVSSQSEVTAEQLSGILRVDSYFGPRYTPRSKLSVRFARLDLNVCNSLPQIYKQATNLEGYYVSKPLMCSHRAIAISALNSNLHCRFNALAGAAILFHTLLSSEIIDCSTGTMEHFTNNFKLQVALSIPENKMEALCLRLCTAKIRLSLHLSRLRTLQVLTNDWNNAVKEYLGGANEPLNVKEIRSQKETAAQATRILEGRVSLWIHNSCSVSLRLGQEDTDEVFPLGPGAKLAYRWRYPSAKRRLRFAIINPTGDWRWSNSVTFALGESRVRLEDVECGGPGAGVFIHVTVTQSGAHRLMRLSGRLVLANMLKLNLLYKVRARLPVSNTWATVSSGELGDESVSRSVVSATNCEMVLKLKFVSHDTGWSGDIPLKECPKENVPWLVKVPSQGAMPYVSVWCRVIRARSDGRIFAAIWPLYVLTSNLTLDTDVLLDTDLGGGLASREHAGGNPPPLIQSAPGRGVRTQLLAPGTTSAKHSLSFQYRNVECPVTREAVPLHYGVTDTSVFDKRVPVNTIEEVVKEIKQWLKSSRRQEHPEWPHSIVSKHFRGEWKPALLQPRCDVAVRYHAIRVGGGGCSLEMELNPVLLICNAAPIAVTLRAHDAAPLCKLEPATIISPPSIILKKPFFMSVEKGRETFVSQQLEVCSTDPGRYGAPPPGQVAVDHPVLFVIPYHDEVTILSLHYELKEEINVMGITSAFVFVNNLDVEVTIATTAVPDLPNQKKVNLNATKYDLVEPSKTTSVQFTPLYQFRLYDRWLGGSVSELGTFLSVCLPKQTHPVPIELGAPPYRRPLNLRNSHHTSIAAVLTQHKHEGRWIATLSADPCPQFLVNNKTSFSVAVAQPYPPSDDANDTVVRVMQECAGVNWWCHLYPHSSMHYSTPGYTFADTLPSEQPPPITWLTFADIQESSMYTWCPPVAISAGEQRVQLSQTVVVKLHVRPYLHSTLVELRDITEEDISADDIRKRLLLSDRMFVDNNTASREMIRGINFDEESKEDRKKLMDKAGMLAMRSLDMKQLEKQLHDFLEQAALKDAEISKKNNNKKSVEQLSTAESSDRKNPVTEQNITEDSKFVDKGLPSGVTDTPEKSVPEINVLMDKKLEEKGVVINENASKSTVFEKTSNVDKTGEKGVDTPFSENIPLSTVSENATDAEKMGEKVVDTQFSKNTLLSTVSENTFNAEKTGEKGVDTPFSNNTPLSTVSENTTNAEKTGEKGVDTPFSKNTALSTVSENTTNAEKTGQKRVDTSFSKNTPQSTVSEKSTDAEKKGKKDDDTLFSENNTQSTVPETITDAEKTGEKDDNTPFSENTPQSTVPEKTTNAETKDEKGIDHSFSENTPQSAEKNTDTEKTSEKGTDTPLSANTTQSTLAEKNTDVEKTELSRNVNDKAISEKVPENLPPDKITTIEEKTDENNKVIRPKEKDQNISIPDKMDAPARNLEKKVTIIESTRNLQELYLETISATTGNEMLTDPIFAKKRNKDVKNYVWEESIHEDLERVKCMISSIVVEMAACGDTSPLLAVHVDRTHLSISTINKTVKTTVTVMDVQIDNLQYESGQYDFAVVAATRADRMPADAWPSVWNMFTDQSAFDSKIDSSRVVLSLCQDSWSVLSYNFKELTEIDFRAGPLALYIEDAYIAALADLLKLVQPPGQPVDEDAALMAEARSLQKPLRLQLLHIQPIDLTLTLHTAVRIYIALDQSPLHLNAFKVHHMFTTTECLAHALTVHYLSAAILSAGWVVGGLELLGAPGALAARVGGATGGVRGIASTTAAALLRSLSACAGSLARNLDLLAGDEEHAKRAAAARRRPPATFVGGLVAGFTNFAINILGAVGGLAHHPLVGVAVGETESSAAALRRSLLGALTKPLSATADLVAYAGHGLLTQTGWDPVPQPRRPSRKEESYMGWRRDCVRWAFRLAELRPIAGFEVLFQDAPVQLIVSCKFVVFAETQCERVIEMIDLRDCYVGPYLGGNIELCVTKTRLPKSPENKPVNEDEELYISEAAMQRVARFAGLEGSAVAGGGGGGAGSGGGADGCAGEGRVLTLVPTPGQAHALHALLLALTHANSPSHFPLI